MPKFEVNLPDALLARMIAELPDVDWDRVAARAFEFELREREREQGPQEMDVDRLRSTDRDHAGEVYYRGYSAGQHYALHVAGAAELENLAALDDERLEQLFDQAPSGPWAHSDRLALLILEGSDEVEIVLELFELKNLNGFWEQAVGADFETHIRDSVFLEGFVEGAVEAWQEQKPAL